MKKYYISEAVIHIDESLKERQYHILNDHMRMQDGVISAGCNNASSHLMIIRYNPEHTNPVQFIRMVERHGYHAERVS